MDFSVLSRYDDILADYFVDSLYLWYNTLRMNGDFVGTKVDKQQIVTRLREHIVMDSLNHLSMKNATDSFMSLPYFQDFTKSFQAKELLEFTQHMKRYLLMYRHNAGFEVGSTIRYTGKPEACLIATRAWEAGEQVTCCVGSIAALSEQDDLKLKREGRDFSVMVSTRKKCSCLFLGPARFMNHDCDSNCEFILLGQNSITFRVIKDIKIGEEMTVFYADHYFGEDNCECLCSSCERLQQGHFSSQKDDSTVVEDSDVEQTAQIENNGSRRSGRKRKEISYKDFYIPDQVKRGKTTSAESIIGPDTKPMHEITNVKPAKDPSHQNKKNDMVNPTIMQTPTNTLCNFEMDFSQQSFDKLKTSTSDFVENTSINQPLTPESMSKLDCIQNNNSSTQYDEDKKTSDFFIDWLDNISDVSDNEEMSDTPLNDGVELKCCDNWKEFCMTRVSEEPELCGRCNRHYQIYGLHWPMRKLRKPAGRVKTKGVVKAVLPKTVSPPPSPSPSISKELKPKGPQSKRKSNPKPKKSCSTPLVNNVHNGPIMFGRWTPNLPVLDIHTNNISLQCKGVERSLAVESEKKEFFTWKSKSITEASIRARQNYLNLLEDRNRKLLQLKDQLLKLENLKPPVPMKRIAPRLKSVSNSKKPVRTRAANIRNSSNPIEALPNQSSQLCSTSLNKEVDPTTLPVIIPSFSNTQTLPSISQLLSANDQRLPNSEPLLSQSRALIRSSQALIPVKHTPNYTSQTPISNEKAVISTNKPSLPANRNLTPVTTEPLTIRTTPLFANRSLSLPYNASITDIATLLPADEALRQVNQSLLSSNQVSRLDNRSLLAVTNTPAPVNQILLPNIEKLLPTTSGSASKCQVSKPTSQRILPTAQELELNNQKSQPTVPPSDSQGSQLDNQVELPTEKVILPIPQIPHQTSTTLLSSKETSASDSQKIEANTVITSGNKKTRRPYKPRTKTPKTKKMSTTPAVVDIETPKAKKMSTTSAAVDIETPKTKKKSTTPSAVDIEAPKTEKASIISAVVDIETPKTKKKSTTPAAVDIEAPKTKKMSITPAVVDIETPKTKKKSSTPTAVDIEAPKTEKASIISAEADINCNTEVNFTLEEKHLNKLDSPVIDIENDSEDDFQTAAITPIINNDTQQVSTNSALPKDTKTKNSRTNKSNKASAKARKKVSTGSKSRTKESIENNGTNDKTLVESIKVSHDKHIQDSNHLIDSVVSKHTSLLDQSVYNQAGKKPLQSTELICVVDSEKDQHESNGSLDKEVNGLNLIVSDDNVICDKTISSICTTQSTDTEQIIEVVDTHQVDDICNVVQSEENQLSLDTQEVNVDELPKPLDVQVIDSASAIQDTSDQAHVETSSEVEDKASSDSNEVIDESPKEQHVKFVKDVITESDKEDVAESATETVNEDKNEVIASNETIDKDMIDNKKKVVDESDDVTACEFASAAFTETVNEAEAKDSTGYYMTSYCTSETDEPTYTPDSPSMNVSNYREFETIPEFIVPTTDNDNEEPSVSTQSTETKDIEKRMLNSKEGADEEQFEFEERSPSPTYSEALNCVISPKDMSSLSPMVKGELLDVSLHFTESESMKRYEQMDSNMEESSIYDPMTTLNSLEDIENQDYCNATTSYFKSTVGNSDQMDIDNEDAPSSSVDFKAIVSSQLSLDDIPNKSYYSSIVDEYLQDSFEQTVDLPSVREESTIELYHSYCLSRSSAQQSNRESSHIFENFVHGRNYSEEQADPVNSNSVHKHNIKREFNEGDYTQLLQRSPAKVQEHPISRDRIVKQEHQEESYHLPSFQDIINQNHHMNYMHPPMDSYPSNVIPDETDKNPSLLGIATLLSQEKVQKNPVLCQMAPISNFSSNTNQHERIGQLYRYLYNDNHSHSSPSISEKASLQSIPQQPPMKVSFLLQPEEAEKEPAKPKKPKVTRKKGTAVAKTVTKKVTKVAAKAATAAIATTTTTAKPKTRSVTAVNKKPSQVKRRTSNSSRIGTPIAPPQRDPPAPPPPVIKKRLSRPLSKRLSGFNIINPPVPRNTLPPILDSRNNNGSRRL